MRQVKARLLKLNGLYGDNSDDSSDNDKNVPPPRPPKDENIIKMESKPPLPNVAPIIVPSPGPSAGIGLKKGDKKRESKWGKNTST